MFKEFEIKSGSIVCSDPCYVIPTWCQGIVDNVKNGTWLAEVDMKDEGNWGVRVASLFIVNKHAFENQGVFPISESVFDEEPLNFAGGVDSGQFGFFDKDFYRNDELAKDLDKENFGENYDMQSGDTWYRACSKLTLGNDQWGVLPNGVVSSSGFGDGSYDVFGLKDDSGEYVAFAVVFIYEGDEEDEYDDAEDWEEDEEEIEE
jgi:hypothetical protein